MRFLPQLPANGPPWLPRFASSIADLFRRVLPAPLKLFSSPTADLPPAADYLGGIIHDSTADTLKIALGAGWSSFSLSTHVHAASTVTFAPAGSVAATDVQAAIEELDTEKLAASSYTAADVLAKLLTVDGAGSGLDADLLDGMSSAAFAAASHTHVIADVTGLQGALDLKAPLADPTFTGTANFATGIFSSSLTANGGVIASSFFVIAANPAATLRDSDTAGSGATGSFAGQDSGNATRWRVGKPFASNNVWIECVGGGVVLATALGGSAMLTVSPTACNMASGVALQANGTQVVSSRITGWAAASGTATRTTFATSTVTTAELAERVKALIDDLRTHGLIGN